MTIEEFQETVMRIRPNNFMALGGAASGIVGAADSGSVAVMQLQRVVITFASCYIDGTNDEQINVTYREVLAKIMVAVTLDAISQDRADKLIDELQQLMKARKQ